MNISFLNQMLLTINNSSYVIKPDSKRNVILPPEINKRNNAYMKGSDLRKKMKKIV